MARISTTQAVPGSSMRRKELRQYRRKRIYIPVECTLNGGMYHSRAWTLGGGGLFLGMPPEFTLGTEFTVRFCPSAPLPTIEAEATVRYQLAGRGVGIEFTEISPEHRRMIMLLVGQRMTERRSYPRVACRVQVADEEGGSVGVSKDISEGGMFIETQSPPVWDSTLKLRFRLNDGGPDLLVGGQPCFVTSNFGVGVRFVGLSPVDRTRIRAYVVKAGRPAQRLRASILAVEKPEVS